MKSTRFVVRAAALAVAALAVTSSGVAAPDNRAEPRITAPPRPDVNVRIAVEPGVLKDKMPEKANGHLARRGAGNGRREGPTDPGPPPRDPGNGNGLPGGR